MPLLHCLDYTELRVQYMHGMSVRVKVCQKVLQSSLSKV
jgi:hypothetical protein